MAGRGAEASLGDMLRVLRTCRGFSLREAGALAELDPAYIHRLETSAKRRPSHGALTRLCRALRASRRQTGRLFSAAALEEPSDE